MEEIAHKRVDAKGLPVAYLEAGRGPPLVLLHGGLATAEIMWGRRIPKLADRYRVIAPDSRGHGGTPNPAEHLGYDQMADDLMALIEALALERPLLAGYSDGAQIGIEFALRHPGVARALVLGGAVTGPTPAYLGFLGQMGFTEPGVVDFEQFERQFGDFAAAIKRDHGTEPSYWRVLLRDISRLWLGIRRCSDAELAGIGDPVLAICGDRDESDSLAETLRLYRLVPDAELGVVPHSGHGAAERDLFWAMAEAFFARHSG